MVVGSWFVAESQWKRSKDEILLVYNLKLPSLNLENKWRGTQESLVFFNHVYLVNLLVI